MAFTETMKDIYRAKAFELSKKNAQLRAICQRAVENNGVLIEEDIRCLTLNCLGGKIEENFSVKDGFGQ